MPMLAKLDGDLVHSEVGGQPKHGECDRCRVERARTWAPLDAGVLSGKYARSGPVTPARVDAGDVSQRDRRIATEVDAVADDLGATSP
jgi:hypothetical protein